MKYFSMFSGIGGFEYGIEQEFEGDFPNIEEYYKIVKPYFVRVIGED